jgi:hypothetical protein
MRVEERRTWRGRESLRRSDDEASARESRLPARARELLQSAVDPSDWPAPACGS